MSNINTNNSVVAIDTLKPNDYNPKPDYNSSEDLKKEFDKIKQSIEYHGQIDSIIVRELEDGSLEIVNGYHRWMAMKELGFTEIEIKNLGKISREEAIKKTLSFEKLKIEVDILKEAQLIKGLAELKVDLVGLPYTPEELSKKLELTDFDWDKYKDDQTGGQGTGENNKLILNFSTAAEKDMVLKTLQDEAVARQYEKIEEVILDLLETLKIAK